MDKDYEHVLAREQKAFESGERLRFPHIEERLKNGEMLKFFDRTNAVFLLVLGIETDDEFKDDDVTIIIPRSLRLFSGLAEMEAKLKSPGHATAGAASAITGSPSEDDGLEYLLYMAGAVGRVRFREGAYQLTLKMSYFSVYGDDGKFIRKAPRDYFFNGADIWGMYHRAESFGTAYKARRYRGAGGFSEKELAQMDALVKTVNEDFFNSQSALDAFAKGQPNPSPSSMNFDTGELGI